MQPLIEIRSVSKAYKLYGRPVDRAIEWATLGAIRRHGLQWALQDISLTLNQGEVVGVVGPNGAGKSTLLKLIARTARPTSGEVTRRARIGALLELGAGFHPDLSGMDNIGLNARLLGFSEGELSSKLQAITDFAGIGEAVHRPVRTFSSGMFVRLAFSIIAVMEPEVLVIDEAIAVGDVDFQMKCLTRIEELRAKGIAIIFVSHDLYRVETLADRAICLVDGKMQAEGTPSQVIRSYRSLYEKDAALAPAVPLHFEQSPVQIRDLTCNLVNGRNVNVTVAYDVLKLICEGLVFRIVFALPDETRVAIIGHDVPEGQTIEPGAYRLSFKVKTTNLYPRRYRLHCSVTSKKSVVYDVKMGVVEVTIPEPTLWPAYHRSADQLTTMLEFDVVPADKRG
ncbi:MAG: ABC transporter ATP-binding protein [Acidobacteria bacterium]|nr:MAG: ABC transporter ATP-binding protein [Acidobacteriota bacterium]